MPTVKQMNINLMTNNLTSSASIKSRCTVGKAINIYHDGKEGYWLEQSLEKKPDNYNKADLFNYELMTPSNLEKIISLFKTCIKFRRPDVKGFNINHDGKEGHWLEQSLGKKPDNYNGADMFSYEIKMEGSKITFGDWKANYTIYEDPVYVHLFKNTNESWTAQDCFCYIFGKPNPKKANRYSWSGKPVPKFGMGYNNFGQAMMLDDNGDIIIVYSHRNDKRENKAKIVPREFWQENLILMKWYLYSSPDEKHTCLKEKFENKFNQDGTLIFQKNKSGFVVKLKICSPIKFDIFLSSLKNNIIILDCGMYTGNNRAYHKWRAPRKFWDEYVIETIT